VDNIYASPVLLGDLRQKNYDDLIVVSPDVGGVVRARALAKQLDLLCRKNDALSAELASLRFERDSLKAQSTV
jgi:phosphoribosylpyrophosphate synthetase